MTDDLCTCGHAMEWHAQLFVNGGSKPCSTVGCDCEHPRASGDGPVTIPVVMTHHYPWEADAGR